MRPEWARGGERVGGFQSVEPPASRRFAAPTPEEASLNVARTAVETEPTSKKSFAAKILDLLSRMSSQEQLAALGGKGERASPLDPLRTGLEALDMLPFAFGILAGQKGARALGGEPLRKFTEGEAASGASQRLWRDYGYSRGAEGKGRFEISDQPAQFKGEGSTVGEALSHNELFKAYPELAKLPLDIKLSLLASRGAFDPASGQVTVRAFEPSEAKSILLHELQHAVQRQEGFAPGTSLRGGADKYERTAGEVEARNVQRRLEDPDLARFAPEMTESIPREMQLIKQDPAAVMEAVKEKGD